jgi:aryl-alcohol dehydrogenase-like predicted oxidoreductase
MHKVILGATGPAVAALGIGCMGMSNVYGPADRYDRHGMAVPETELGSSAAH